MFGNQNTVCKPTTSKWRLTVKKLEQAFPGHSKSESSTSP
ncbi:MAG: nuclease, partial [Cyanobacteria bacterium J06623_4]